MAVDQWLKGRERDGPPQLSGQKSIGQLRGMVKGPVCLDRIYA